MIYGMGTDLVHVPDFAHQLEEPGSEFVSGTFTEREQQTAAERHGDRSAHLAARFAAKEAFVKAWSGARFGRPPHLTSISLREIEVVSDAWGRPSLRLHGAVGESIDALGIERIHVSMSHDGPSATAVVLLEIGEQWTTDAALRSV